MFLSFFAPYKDWYYITIASIAVFLSYSVGGNSFNDFFIFPDFILPNPGDALSVWSLFLEGWFLCRGVTIVLNRFNKGLAESGRGILRVSIVVTGIIFLVGWIGTDNDDLRAALRSLGIGVGVLAALIIPKLLWRMMDKFDLSKNNILWTQSHYQC